MAGTLIFGGDIAPVRADPTGMFGDVAPLISKADLALANLEIALSNRGRPVRGKPIAHTGPAEAIEGLVTSGFDAFNLANNHILDFGEEPLLDTLERLRAAGLGFFGAGRNATAAAAPYITECKGIKIGLLGYTTTLPQGFAGGIDSPGVNALRVRTAYHPLGNLDEYPGTEPVIDTWPVEEDLRRMCEEVTRFRKLVDVVLVYQHWGSSITETIHEFQRIIGKTAIDCGADGVFGGHQHVVSAIEFYREKPIVHGLGNLLFDIKAPFLTEFAHRTFLFGATVTRAGLRDYYLVHCRTGVDGPPHSVHVESEDALIVATLKRLSIPFGTRFDSAGDRVLVSMSGDRRNQSGYEV
jgi:poly-gamma-glutamate capsule biosynthesis protein CapA/YwtB (metallophosphatase superfamily)